MPVTRHYDDPVLSRSPESRPEPRGRYRIGKVREPKLSSVPKCFPGTIVYRDKLVNHFGSRFANDFRRRYIASKTGPIPRPELVLPTDQDFIDNPPWRYLR